MLADSDGSTQGRIDCTCASADSAMRGFEDYLMDAYTLNYTLVVDRVRTLRLGSSYKWTKNPQGDLMSDFLPGGAAGLLSLQYKSRRLPFGLRHTNHLHSAPLRYGMHTVVARHSIKRFVLQHERTG